MTPGEEALCRVPWTKGTEHSGRGREQLPHGTRVLAKGRRKLDQPGASKPGEERDTNKRSKGGRRKLPGDISAAENVKQEGLTQLERDDTFQQDDRKGSFTVRPILVILDKGK